MNKPNLLNVPSYRQTPSFCGPASLKIVLDYYGVHKEEADLAQLLGTTEELGTDAVSIKRGATDLGFAAEIHDYCTLADIQGWLDKEVPVIVDWFSASPDEDGVADGHYSVAVGLDRDFIYLEDPETGGLRKIRREDFMRVWFDYAKEYLHAPEDLIIRQLIAVYPKG